LLIVSSLVRRKTTARTLKFEQQIVFKQSLSARVARPIRMFESSQAAFKTRLSYALSYN
jgi:hypothetical protein